MVHDGEVASCRLRRFVHSIRIWIRVDRQQRHVDKWKTVMYVTCMYGGKRYQRIRINDRINHLTLCILVT